MEGITRERDTLLFNVKDFKQQNDKLTDNLNKNALEYTEM